MREDLGGLSILAKDLFEEKSRRKGAHPAMAILRAYSEGVLPQESSGVIQEHLAFCPECVSELLSYERLEDGAHSGFQHGKYDKAWARISRRLHRFGESRPETMTPAVQIQMKRQLVVLARTLATLLFMALLFRLAILEDSIHALSQPQADIPIINLVQGTTRSQSHVTRVEPHELSTRWVAVLHLGANVNHSESSDYLLAIFDSNRRLVRRIESIKGDSPSYITVALPSDFLSAGDYSFQLVLRGEPVQRIIGEYPVQILPFSLEK